MDKGSHCRRLTAFANPQMQLQNARKQIEQHETNKQQTIAALSAEVVRFSQKEKDEEEEKKGGGVEGRRGRGNSLDLTYFEDGLIE